MVLTPGVLDLDPEAETARIVRRIREELGGRLRRRGLVLGVSGGVDSGVCAALSARAVGPQRVLALLMPETDSSPDSTRRGRELVRELGIGFLEVDITPTLEAIGCYRWRDEAIARVFPGYDGTWPHKLVIRGHSEGRLNHFFLVMETPEGHRKEARLPLHEYLQIVAATSFKQRTRKTLEYFHADRLNYAVVGTPNRLEYDQGFFVKLGDGAADLKPIAHLYKTQVYQLADHLKLPGSIRDAQPTTDTYSLPQGQDEFFFALPYHQMDLALWAYNHGVPSEELARVLELDPGAARGIYSDIEAKRRTTSYQHLAPILMERVEGVGKQAESGDS